MSDAKEVVLNLHATMDAQTWAKEFMRIRADLILPLEEDDMRGWFANAIMCGFDHANQQKPLPAPEMPSEEEIAGMAWDYTTEYGGDSRQREGFLAGFHAALARVKGEKKSMYVIVNAEGGER